MKSLFKFYCTSICGILGVAALGANSAIAATFVVTNTNSSGEGSLYQAILDANASPGANTIDFLLGPGQNTIIFSTITIIDGDLTINGPGANLLTVGYSNGRLDVFDINGGTVDISGLTITNGLDGIGNGGTLTVSNSIISGNSTNGIYNGNGGTLTVSNSIISGNRDNQGAGIDNLGTAIVNNSTLSGNQGSGILNQSGTAIVNNSTLSGNQGDGIYVLGGTVIVNDSTLSSNRGSGLEDFMGTAIVNDSTLSSNQGNGLLNFMGTATVNDSTLSSNQGAGISNNGGTVSLGNSIIAQNLQADVLNSPFRNLTGTISDKGYNLIGNGDGSPFAGQNGVNGDIVGTSANPVDPKLGPLADNGGPTFTQALLPGSPAIDAGSNALIPTGVTTDQRGLPRIANGTVDIGAFEVQAQTRSVPEPTSTLETLAFSTLVGTSFVLKRQLKK